MTDEQIINARSTFALLGRGRDLLHFFYLAGNEDAVPVLLLDPDEIDPVESGELLDTALDPRTAEGVMSWQASGTLLIQVTEGDTLALVEEAGGFLDQVLPGLRFAQVRSPQ